jgi:hypothetical protein
MTRRTAVTPAATLGRRRMSRSKTGSRTRRSTATKAARASTLPANEGQTQAGQPLSRPKVSGTTSASSAADRSAAPAKSSRRGGPGAMSGSPRRAPISSSAPTGA